MFETWAKTIGEALLNSLWQGAVLTLLAALLLKLNRRASASERYVVCLITLAAVLAFPVLQVIWPAAARPLPAASMAPPPAELIETAPPLSAISVERTAPSFRLPIEVSAGTAANLLVGFWMVLAALYCLRLALAYRGLQRIKSEAGPVPAPYDGWWGRWLLASSSVREPQLRASNRISLPLTAGLREPAIVFPASLLDKLTEPEARTIWLHELAHVRRLDDWTKLGQKLAEALLFFHPAVHWLGRQMENEREIACDDWVVRQTGAPRPYAACLAKLAAYASPRPSASPAPAMAADQKQIFRRVKMIINKTEKTSQNESRASGVLIAVFLLAIAGVMVAADPIIVLADTQTAEAPPVPPAPPSPTIADAAPPAPPAPSSPAAVSGVAPVLPASPVPPPQAAAAGAPPVPPVSPTPPQEAATTGSPPVPPASPAPPPALPRESETLPEREPRPEPKPVVTPRPNPLPNPEMDAEFRQRMKTIREEMAGKGEEMRVLSQRLHEEIQANLAPHQEELRRLARKISETVHQEMQPRIAELRETAVALQKEHMATLPNEAHLAELNQKMAELQQHIEETSRLRIRALEEQMHELEKQIKPSEEVLKKFEDKMRELEFEMREKGEQMRELEYQENRQPRSESPSSPGAF